MCTTISIINNKGGVGKTTSTGIISEILSYLGKRVLMIDLDQQSNLSMMFNCFIEDSDDVINGLVQANNFNIAELFKHRFRETPDVESLITTTPIPNISIIAASKRHKYTPGDIQKSTGNNNIILKKALESIKSDYDFILIDNAPANDILTVNSMFASDLVFVPVRVEKFSYKGLKETMDSLLFIKKEHDLDQIKFGGVFITQAETNTNIYKGIDENYRSELGEDFLKTPIRKDIKVSEIETNFVPILEYCPDTNAVFDYSQLILEMNILDSQTQDFLKRSISA